MMRDKDQNIEWLEVLGRRQKQPAPLMGETLKCLGDRALRIPERLLQYPNQLIEGRPNLFDRGKRDKVMLPCLIQNVYVYMLCPDDIE
jgi:hypothetical protein